MYYLIELEWFSNLESLLFNTVHIRIPPDISGLPALHTDDVFRHPHWRRCFSLIRRDQIEKDQSFKNDPGNFKEGVFGQKFLRNCGEIHIFWSVSWLFSHISKVKNTVFYSSKVERNGHFPETSRSRFRAKTWFTLIKRIRENVPILYVTDMWLSPER